MKKIKQTFKLGVIVFSSISIKSQNKSRFASTGETVYYSLEIALLHPNRVLFLDLSGAHLIEVPEEIFELTNLIALDLSNNFLTKVPKEILMIRNLKSCIWKEILL